MSTYEVKDRRDWKAGDDVRMPLEHGAVITGEAYVSKTGALCVGDRIIRFADGIYAEVAVTVTREIPDIPEPTGLGAVVKFEDGIPAVLADESGNPRPWHTPLHTGDDCWASWEAHVKAHGPAVALLSPGVQDGAR